MIMLILVVGLPGTGKTTFAEKLAKEINGIHINSDKIRIEIGKQGEYDSTSKAAVYKALQEKAEEILKQQKHIVVDATLYKNILREPFTELAVQYKTPIMWIELKADEKVVRDRVEVKRKYSEANFEVYQKIKAAYEPLGIDHLVLWSDRLEITEMIKKAKDYLRYT
jgi:predicted kinase